MLLSIQGITKNKGYKKVQLIKWIMDNRYISDESKISYYKYEY